MKTSEEITVSSELFERLDKFEIIEVNGHQFIRKDIAVKLMVKYSAEQLSEKNKEMAEYIDKSEKLIALMKNLLT